MFMRKYCPHWIVSLTLLTSAGARADFPVHPCRQVDVKGWVAELPQDQASCPAPSAAWRMRSFKLDETRTLCSYEWKSSSSPTHVGLPHGLDYSADCMAVGVSTKDAPFHSQPDIPVSDNLADVEADFLDALDAPKLSIPIRASIALDFPTLAFIDAEPVPARVPQLGAIQHGNSLSTLAELLGGCDHVPCKFRQGWYGEPALFPFAYGQVVGSPLDTAQALDSAVAGLRPEAEQHIVYSIGLGFEADADCDALPNSPVVAALRESIRRAACANDAIVIAPVGNIRPDDVTIGMLYPAAFQNEQLVCDGVKQGRPLVAAISGVDGQLHPLSTSRANAQLMTIGGPWAHAGPPEERLNPRTASSVAVAAAGPLISLAWWMRPDLDAKQLLETLRHSGSDTQPSTKGSVLKVCPALRALCSDKKQGRCSELQSLCPARLEAKTPRMIVAPPAAAPAPSPGSTPLTSCVGRGQRLDPYDPGE